MQSGFYKELARAHKRVAHEVKSKNFDWQAYEKEHAGDSIFESKAYLKARKKILRIARIDDCFWLFNTSNFGPFIV